MRVMSQGSALAVDELIRAWSDLRRVNTLRNHDALRTASGPPINEATEFARGRELMSRDVDPAKALNAAMNGLVRSSEMGR